MSEGKLSIGVDMGGTFTDVVVLDRTSGDVELAKQPTQRRAPEAAVLDGVSRLVSSEGLRRCETFLFATTVGLNVLLERRGPRLALLTTRGFRDVLELRRGDRDETFNLFWKAPPPLVPRRLRLPISERIRADGSVERPLEEADVLEALEACRREDVVAIAVVLLNAYTNSSHECRVEELLRAHGFEGDVSLSHRASGEYREYERASTTVVDAYVRPAMSHHLQRLEQELGERGFGGSFLVTRSDGGASSIEEAVDRSFEGIVSGPVAGVRGASTVGRTLGIADLVTADVGGTSFDTALIRDGRPPVLYAGSVAGMPIQSPWVDVRSVGAGGGSIAYSEGDGELRVGPRSAGADPGPACYARGGTEPTVTDAALALGMLGDGQLGSGLWLSRELSDVALDGLAQGLGLGVRELARDVMAVAAANMANAVREITIEQGYEPGDASLMAFGGAGPLFATLLASELGISTIVVPLYPGNFSAWGLLSAAVARTAARTCVIPLDDDGVARGSEILDQLFEILRTRDGDTTSAAREIGVVTLDMRYVGQEYTLSLDVETGAARIAADADSIRTAFGLRYEQIFGHVLEDEVEIVTLRARTHRPVQTLVDSGADGSAPDGAAPRYSASPPLPVYSFTAAETVDFAVLDRAAVGGRDGPIVGPALITEDTATTYVDDSFSCEVHPTGHLLVHRRGAR